MLQTASAMGLLRTILIIVFVYFSFKILARIFAPFLVHFVAKKAEEKFGQQFGGFQNNNQKSPKQKEGETVIDKMPKKNSTSDKKIGEYIDYEELD